MYGGQYLGMSCLQWGQNSFWVAWESFKVKLLFTLDPSNNKIIYKLGVVFLVIHNFSNFHESQQKQHKTETTFWKFRKNFTQLNHSKKRIRVLSWARWYLLSSLPTPSLPKGQLISKCYFSVFKFSQKTKISRPEQVS